MAVTFVVTTPSFSGPVELLLQLISSHDVDVLDVPLGPIVDAFVAVLRDDAVTLEVEDLSEFLLIAAIFLEMKSRSLLPGRDDAEPDEEFIGRKERDVLHQRASWNSAPTRPFPMPSSHCSNAPAGPIPRLRE